MSNKANVGDEIVISKTYFENSRYISQFLPTLAPQRVYEIVEVQEPFQGAWGISILKDVETSELLDISKIEQLENYWCILDSEDPFRVIQ